MKQDFPELERLCDAVHKAEATAETHAKDAYKWAMRAGALEMELRETERRAERAESIIESIAELLHIHDEHPEASVVSAVFVLVQQTRNDSE